MSELKKQLEEILKKEEIPDSTYSTIRKTPKSIGERIGKVITYTTLYTTLGFFCGYASCAGILGTVFWGLDSLVGAMTKSHQPETYQLFFKSPFDPKSPVGPLPMWWMIGGGIVGFFTGLTRALSDDE